MESNINKKIKNRGSIVLVNFRLLAMRRAHATRKMAGPINIQYRTSVRNPPFEFRMCELPAFPAGVPGHISVGNIVDVSWALVAVVAPIKVRSLSAFMETELLHRLCTTCESLYQTCIYMYTVSVFGYCVGRV